MVGKIIGVDVDGVLAAFEHGYAPLLTKHSGIEFPKLDQIDVWPDTWYWERAAGVTKEQEKATWADIMADQFFWYNLPAHAHCPEFLYNLYKLTPEVDVYFVTSRAGRYVKTQTENWLHKYGFPEATVLISSDKGSICKALKVTHYIDDKDENCADVAAASPATKCYMLRRPWNAGQHAKAVMVPTMDRGPVEVPVLGSVMDFLKIVKEG